MAQKIKLFQIDIDSELILLDDPISKLGATTKQYVDNKLSKHIISSGPGYTITNDNIIYYSGQSKILANSNNISILPIANNLKQKLLFSSSDPNIIFESLSNTQLTIKNITSMDINTSWHLIAI